jgi:hypothetical protein
MDNGAQLSSIVVELDRPRRLKLGLNAICEFEQLTGSRFFEMADRPLSLLEVRALLYVGLRADDPSLTIEQTGDLIEAELRKGGGIGGVFSMIVEARDRALGGPSGKKNETEPASPGAGSALAAMHSASSG